jgi:hypothetical protein
MNRKMLYCAGTVGAALSWNGAGAATDSVSYSYDALGRLVAVSTSGGPNNGQAVATAYDPAGNRSSYSLTGAGGSPPPPPPPPPGNTPPVANPDTLSLAKCQAGTATVTANDTDADGDLPLAVIGINDTSGYAYWVSPSQVGWAGSPPGTYSLGYAIQDSRGAQASGTLTVTVSGTGTTCP